MEELRQIKMDFNLPEEAAVINTSSSVNPHPLPPIPSTPTTTRRGRARSSSFHDGERPTLKELYDPLHALNSGLDPVDSELNRDSQDEQAAIRAYLETAISQEASIGTLPFAFGFSQSSRSPIEDPFQDSVVSNTSPDTSTSAGETTPGTRRQRLRLRTPRPSVLPVSEQAVASEYDSDNSFPDFDQSVAFEDSYTTTPTPLPPPFETEEPSGGSNTPKRATPSAAMMSFQNFVDLSQGAGSASRQAPSPNQSMNHANGINGNAVGLPGMTAGLPTPAGHQQDLNLINNLLEEYGRIMDENRQATARIVEATGRIREQAMAKDMTNDELIDSVSKELNDSTKNLEVECSELRKKLDIASNEASEYLGISYAYAKTMGRMLEQVHAFKLKTTEDMCAWHMSYRTQLEQERRTNLELRLQIDDMRAHAASGQEALTSFMREWNGTPAYYEYMTENVCLKQLVRSYKRMALPFLADDDSEFSDDDDLIDPEEKKRLAKEDMRRAEAKFRAKEAAAQADEASLAQGMADSKLE